VADAIAQHYQPLGPNDACPSAPVSVCVALADKVDTLAGFWAINEKPTGSKDPYALRRAALGVIRLVVENRLRLHLIPIFEEALRLQELDKLEEERKAKEGKSTLSSFRLTVHVNAPGWDRQVDQDALSLLEFLCDRLKVLLRDQGVRHDLITAVMACGGEDDLVRLLSRVEALAGFLASDDGANLLTAYRRAANIVRIEEKKDKRAYQGAVQADSLRQAEEKTLFSHLADASKGAQIALRSEDFTAAMAAMARLRQPVDAFFDEVTVNAEDKTLRENRLQLLGAIGATLAEVADFSKIEG
jgi:glycyl-tRNA synthetase beta chain